MEIIVGDNHLLANDAKVLDAGIAEDTLLSVVFKPNIAICSNKDAIASLGGIVDSQDLLAVVIPSDETQILEHAFKDCRTLAKLTIPESVTSIGNRAFAGCSALASLTIPESVIYIGVGAFAGCSGLTSLNIPESLRIMPLRTAAPWQT